MINNSRPKASSLISNLLNRVDGKFLAIKRNNTGGIMYYLESDSVKQLMANKESLKPLNYDELSLLISGQNLIRESFTLSMFNLIEHTPERKLETIRNKGSIMVRGIKEVDKIGTDKFSDTNTNKPNQTKNKYPRKRT